MVRLKTEIDNSTCYFLLPDESSLQLKPSISNKKICLNFRCTWTVQCAVFLSCGYLWRAEMLVLLLFYPGTLDSGWHAVALKQYLLHGHIFDKNHIKIGSVGRK